MELITLLLAVWVLVLSIKVGDHTKSLEQVQKTLARFKPVGKKKREEAVQLSAVPETAQPMHASGLVQEPEVSHQPPTEEVFEKVPTGGSESFENVLIKKILPTIGVLSVLLAIIFIVTWSYTNNIIGPGTLLVMAGIASVIMVGAGEVLRRGFPKYYGYVTSAGLLGLFTTLYASHGVYGFISNESAFVLYIGLLMFSYGVALRYNNRIISFLVSAGSFVIPQLVAGEKPQPYVLMAYSSLIFVAGAVIMYKKDWKETIAAVFISLLLYAGMLLDAVTGSILDPFVFLGWVYTALVVFALVIIKKVSEPEREGENRGLDSAMTGATISLLVSFLVVNIFANIVFGHFDWSHFGFFVLIQGFLLYGLSLLIPETKPRAYKELFILGACGSVLFAILYELGFDTQAFFMSLVLFGYSVLALFAAKKVTYGASVYKVFGYIAQALGVVAIFSVSGFTETTITMFVGVAVALYAARSAHDEQGSLGFISYAEILLAIILFVIWNYSILEDKLSSLGEQIVPYIIGCIAVGILAFIWTNRKHTYLIGTALALAVFNALHFVTAVDYTNPDKVLLLGFLAALVGLYAPLGIAYYQKVTATGTAL